MSIKTLKDVLDRCVEDGDCWVWLGAKSRGARGASSWSTPVAWFAQARKKTSVRKIVAALAGLDGEKVWRTCESAHCVNPRHLMAGTPAEYGKWMADAGRMRTETRKAANVASGRRRSRLTDDAIAEIRTSHKPTPSLAAEFGVSKQYVQQIRRGGALCGHSASVFGWRP